MFQLRPYQQALLKQTQDALATNPCARVMLQLPTGGGKTVIAGELLADWLQNGRKAVWLTHRKELAEQTRRMLTDAGVSAITNVNWRPGDDAPALASGGVILMSQTVTRRIREREVWSEFNSNDLLVIDEAHHAAAPGWERAMQQWPGPIVGMTATPWRLSQKEGFDLPDASCVIIARPTMSLALYLQMVGRGLRPKPDGGDCLILDLAANSVRHGLPEQYRKWTLKPRRPQTDDGEGPVVVCPECGAVSPASSHHCRGCGYAFGKDCSRCGRWRSRRAQWADSRTNLR